MFGKEKETKEEKQERMERELLQKYGLQNLSNSEDVESVRKIVAELTGTGFMEMGVALSLTDAKVSLPIYYQRAMLEQNFIIIRQLDRISKLLER